MESPTLDAEDARLAELLKDADRRDPAAMTALARRVLIGRNAPAAPHEAVGLLIRAAELGHADASEILATLTGAGAWMPQDWNGALDRLVEAAELGSERARAQLRILAVEGAAAQDDWRGLRSSIDLGVWLETPERQTLCEAPRVRAAPGFAGPAVCEWLMDKARGHLQPSMMFDGQKSTFLATRTCSDFVFDIMVAGLVLVLVRTKIAAVTRLPTVAMEPPQIFHYALGQEIKPHYDYLYDGKTGYGRDGGYQGDRIATFLLYLNDDYDGGELDFPRVGLRHRGRQGDGVYFAHVDGAGQPEKLSLHAALPITRGEKFILSQWIHDRPFTANA
jgi:hypothetical protein